MSLPLILRPEAIGDFEQIRAYLDSQRSGLGTQFLERLRESRSYF